MKTPNPKWHNPASAENGRRGGRPLQTFKLSGPAAIYVRQLTKARLGRTDITSEEASETLEQILLKHAKENPPPEPQ